MSHSRASQLWIFIVLLSAFGLRAAAAWKWHSETIESGRVLRLGDSDSYWILAGHIARGEPYEYGSPDASIFRAPLYPLVLAPLTLQRDPASGIWCARLLGCVLGTCAVGLVMALTQRLGGMRAAVASGLVAAFYPGAIGMSVVILSEAVFCPLMLLTLLGWHTAMQNQRLRSVGWLALATGACSGLAILARPSWLLFMPLAGVCVLLFHKRRGHQLLVLVTMAAGCVCVMTPWWLRNAKLTARFVPTTLQVGASLYDGLHAGASGASDENMAFVNDFISEQRIEEQQERKAGEAMGIEEDPQFELRKRSSFEYRLNARMQSAAISWVKKNVSGAFRLSLVKFCRTWSVWPNGGEVGSTPLRILLTLGCFGVLGLAAWASWQSFRSSSWLIVLCWMPAIYFTLLHMVFVGSIRYREPAVLVLTVLAGCALSQLTTKKVFSDGQGSLSIESRAHREVA